MKDTLVIMKAFVDVKRVLEKDAKCDNIEKRAYAQFLFTLLDEPYKRHKESMT